MAREQLVVDEVFQSFLRVDVELLAADVHLFLFAEKKKKMK